MNIKITAGCLASCIALGVASASAQVTIDSVQSYDGYIHLYAGSFDSSDQLTNLIAGNDDGPGGLGTSQLLDLVLAPGDYVLVTSGFEAGDCGDYTTTISGTPSAMPDMISGNTCDGPLWDRPIAAGPSISGLGPVNYRADSFTIVPEPASGLLLLSGLLGLTLRRNGSGFV